MDFKTGGFMYMLGGLVVLFVTAQSLFFMLKAWKHGKKIGMKKSDMINAVTSSALFTIAPAIAILATVVTLAGTLGLVLPWIRLTVIGNLMYEVTAAQAALDSFHMNFGVDVQDPKIFAAIAWVMTVGSIFPLVLLPIFLKKIQQKIGQAASKASDSRLPDIISAATFIGLISAFVGNSLAGKGTYNKATHTLTPGAGVASVSVLIISILTMIILQKISNHFKLTKFDPFIMPISMFVGMGSAILLKHVLPSEIFEFEWRPVEQ